MASFPKSPYSKVYDVICGWLATAPGLTGKIELHTGREGSPLEKGPAASGPLRDRPRVRLVMGAAGGAWFDPSTTDAELRIQVEMSVSSLDQRELYDLFFAVVRAIFPLDDGSGVRHNQQLMAASAASGVITVVPPTIAVKDDSTAAYLQGVALLRVDVAMLT